MNRYLALQLAKLPREGTATLSHTETAESTPVRVYKAFGNGQPERHSKPYRYKGQEPMSQREIRQALGREVFFTTCPDCLNPEMAISKDGAHAYCAKCAGDADTSRFAQALALLALLDKLDS